MNDGTTMKIRLLTSCTVGRDLLNPKAEGWIGTLPNDEANALIAAQYAVEETADAPVTDKEVPARLDPTMPTDEALGELLKLTVPQIVANIDAGKNIKALQRLAELEAKGDNRKGVQDGIDKRIAELVDAGGAGD
jgi:hypothetical protein